MDGVIFSILLSLPQCLDCLFAFSFHFPILSLRIDGSCRRRKNIPQRDAKDDLEETHNQPAARGFYLTPGMWTQLLEKAGNN